MEKLLERMARLLQPRIAESVEGLVLGCSGGLTGPAVYLVNGGVATGGRRGSDAGFHDQLDSITWGDAAHIAGSVRAPDIKVMSPGEAP